MKHSLSSIYSVLHAIYSKHRRTHRENPDSQQTEKKARVAFYQGDVEPAYLISEKSWVKKSQTGVRKTGKTIVCGGGWKGTRPERVKVKAWIVLLAAIAFGCVSLAASEPVWVYCAGIPAGFSFLASVVLFIREKPQVFEFPWGRANHDPRNQYGACGSTERRTDCPNAEGAAPNGDAATQPSNSRVAAGPPSAS